jgi:hypothetical protein
MLDRIDSIEKILHLNIPTFTAILEEHKIATLGPSFNSIEYFRKLQEGAICISLLITTIEVRLETPSWDPQDPLLIYPSKRPQLEIRIIGRC